MFIGMGVGALSLAFGVAVGCGGVATEHHAAQGSGGAAGGVSSGGAAGSAAKGSAGSGGSGEPGCASDSDCTYPLLCLECGDGTKQCPSGASCVDGTCETSYAHECSALVGSGGSGGSGGGAATDAGAAGTVSIEFSVGGSYCSHNCGVSPRLSILDADNHVVSLGGLCDTDCATCIASGCPPTLCLPDAAVHGTKLEWDGTYYAESTCGAGLTCSAKARAKPGRYTATFCATPGVVGVVGGGSAGAAQCVERGVEVCRTVEFDFPADAVVKGSLP